MLKARLFRSPGSLRLLTLCFCDWKILTAPIVLGYGTIECIHPSQRSVTQRIMKDNIFEIETATIAAGTCYSEDPGILLTDFSYACPNVDQRWIFMVLERAGVPETLQSFFRGYMQTPSHTSSMPAQLEGSSQ